MRLEPDLETARHNLIAKELGALGVCANNQFGQFDKLVNVCYRLMTSVPHENRLPSTGVVLLSGEFDQYRFDCGDFWKVPPSEEEICWALADGVHSFVAKDREGVALLVLKTSAVDELGLFSAWEDIFYGSDRDLGPSNPPNRECLLIKRSEESSTRRLTILTREKIVNVSGLLYVPKPYQYDILKELRQLISPFPWTADCDQTLKSALRLVVHKLSPENCGATLVILSPDDMSPGNEIKAADRLIINQAISPPNCSLTKREYHRPLAHLMGQIDGATIVSPQGDVLHVGAFFQSVGTEKNEAERLPLHGTRHRSAEEFSKEIEGIVIVVSSNGPVSVYRKGQKLPIRDIGDS